MSEELTNFRAEVRNWAAANIPTDWREAATHAEFVASQRAWFAKLVQGGYAVPHWPAKCTTA